MPLYRLPSLAADAAAGIDLALFAQYGVLGIITALLIFFARGAHQREKDRADKAEAENQRLVNMLIDKLLPALTSATEAAEDSTQLLREMANERQIARELTLMEQRRRLEGGPTP